MTDVNPTPDDVDVEVSEEEVAAAETISLKDLGVEPRTTPVVDLLKIYNEYHGNAEEYRKAQKKEAKGDSTDPVNVIKSRVEKAKKSPEMSDTVDNLQAFGHTLKESAFANPLSLITSSVLVEECESLLSLLKGEFAYHFDAAVQLEKDRQGITVTASESAIHARLACIKLRSLIENRVNLAKVLEDEELPSNLFKIADPAKGTRGGFNTDVFPKTPRPFEGENTVSSSSFSSAHLAFRFITIGNLEIPIPDGTTLRVVAHDVVSAGAYRVTERQISDDLKKGGFGIGATDTEWSLKYETGTLFGRKVSG